MKNYDDVSREINIIIKEAKKRGELSTKKRNDLTKRLDFLKTILLYLNTNPSEELINKEIAKLNKKLEILELRYTTWISENPEARGLKNPRPAFDTAFEIPRIKNQLKTLNYILS